LEPVQLEHIGRPNALERYKLLLLSYDGQKPPAPVFHDRIADWVRAGGCLLYIGNGADPFHHAPGWWNADGKNAAKAYDHLFAMLGIGERASDAPQPVGDGYVRVLATRPAELSMRPDGPEYVQSAVKELFECAGRVFETQNYLCVRRGPYVVAAVLEETASKAPLTLDGAFIDLFQPTLPVIERKALAAGECGFLYDLEWAREHRPDGKVLAAAARIKRERWVDGAFNFVARGPQATNARAQILLPRAPKRITTVPSVEVGQEWNAEYGLLELTFPNVAQDIAFTIHQ